MSYQASYYLFLDVYAAAQHFFPCVWNVKCCAALAVLNSNTSQHGIEPQPRGRPKSKSKILAKGSKAVAKTISPASLVLV